jgi:hypothetical protein
MAEEFVDKCRKRGIRIAQKGTYKHHEHDNFAKCRGWRFVYCMEWDGHPHGNWCPGCKKLTYHRNSNGPALDNELAEHLLGWDYEGEWEIDHSDLVEPAP